MSNLLEETIAKISANIEVLDTLPKNNKKNTNNYVKKIDELKEEYSGYEKEILNEMDRRYELFNMLTQSPEISVVEQELLKARNVLYLLNDVSTSFEKMKLDEVTYDLRYYYKKNLEVVNDSIFYCLKRFKEVGINLKLKDFCYSKYVREYLNVFFEELNSTNINHEKIKNKFEEIYWECSNIIIYIELNIRSIYYKNQKNIDKYFAEKQKQLFEKTSIMNISNKYSGLKKQLTEKISIDKAIAVHKLIEGDMSPKDFTDQAIYERQLKFIPKETLDKANDNKLNEIKSNIEQLSNSVYEYKNYIKYKFIVDSVKKIYEEKEKYKNTFLQIKKEIASEEKKIEKLDKKISAASKKSNDKLISEQDALILKIKEMYRELEKNKVYYTIFNELKDNSTISDSLYLASSFYNYIADCMRGINKDVSEDEITTLVQELREFVLWPYSTILNNITILEEKDMLLMIKDRYQLLGVNVTREDLDTSNLDMLMSVINNIEIGYNIKKNEIDVEEIKYICDYKKILGK